MHRIGRTGRAGRSGLAITLAGFRDRFKIRNIEHFTQQRIGEAVVEGHEPRNKPPSTGGGFGGGRGGYGGRGGDRSLAAGSAAVRAHVVDSIVTRPLALGYRGRSAGAAAFGSERSFDRAPANRPRFGDDRGSGRFGDVRSSGRFGEDRNSSRFGDDRADRGHGRDFAPRFDAPRAAEDRGGTFSSRDAAPRKPPAAS